MPKLQDYLAEYYDDVYEMQKLVEAEQVDFTGFEDLISRSLMNQFVIHADSQGLALFEDELGLETDLSLSLETRRYNILMHSLPPHPITIKYLRELLKNLNIPAVVEVDYIKSQFYAYLERSQTTKDQIDRLKYLLNVYLPANLFFSIITTAEADVQQRLYFGAVHVTRVATSAPTRLKTASSINQKLYFGSIAPQVLTKAIAYAKEVKYV
ncbi:hypothetical protein FC83_GL000902 [Agrilactobacillus composti DSM 18527 = JCM 14202]|uniref:DUF2313 domain-containing protein n=1 Tax=Agrilactobacillus composti DSM 18527 = JCM 14202 TaxID=1423734 RepID=X0QR73_9LACO|nr:putative phage tail protein [Agrilactobacillus composti]KRM35599.1 hypothetical protein FC83_GL000902 [Agrilactobacillus composti DSM 18527 = JCM 14202]GAF41115.1 phage related protein [Agrilactobacillus composti DSM 18527 = JCM 14202]